MNKLLTRREFLRTAALGAAGVAVVACQPQTVIVRETVEVEKEVEKVVKETVVVEKEVVVTPTPGGEAELAQAGGIQFRYFVVVVHGSVQFELLAPVAFLLPLAWCWAGSARHAALVMLAYYLTANMPIAFVVWDYQLSLGEPVWLAVPLWLLASVANALYLSGYGLAAVGVGIVGVELLVVRTEGAGLRLRRRW